MSTLRELIESLGTLPDEGIIYAQGSSKEWHPNSRAVVEIVDEYGDVPLEVSGCKNFMSCTLAKELLNDAADARKRSKMAALTLDQRVGLVIYYAIHDTLPPIAQW